LKFTNPPFNFYDETMVFYLPQPEKKPGDGWKWFEIGGACKQTPPDKPFFFKMKNFSR